MDHMWYTSIFNQSDKHLCNKLSYLGWIGLGTWVVISRFKFVGNYWGGDYMNSTKKNCKGHVAGNNRRVIFNHCTIYGGLGVYGGNVKLSNRIVSGVTCNFTTICDYLTPRPTTRTITSNTKTVCSSNS